ncbi:MAG: DUF4115 domain-containing protein [Candidatus Marinimicrobia bacterium]|nr:DUF4115 domain-containing protein [Candidatus Neomarinimicrobiota bacterium]MCF7829615.1 DUF4115 domain-containing protein [Candidatus Neomarinimicrobiota bacterium]MCF7879775.1 DUF4115 domain-containing protein [Candidatus Neomarinimicrobiota bacterium]
MENFFQEFKEHRQNQSITLEEISARTKINVRFLRAIEEGDFDVLPETYMRLFLRAYAVEIGIDPDEAIERLELHEGTITEPRPKNEKKPKQGPGMDEEDSGRTTPPIDLKPKNKFNWKRTLIVIAIFGFAIWIVKSYVDSSSINETTPPVTTQDTAVTDTNNNAQPPVISEEEFQRGTVIDESQESVRSTAPNEQIVLRLNAVDRTWVRVRRDTLPSQEFTFLPQDTRTWRAVNEIEIMIGNSAGANLILNGDPLGNLGAPNTVTNLVITREGIVNKRTVVPQSVSDTTATDTNTN